VTFSVRVCMLSSMMDRALQTRTDATTPAPAGVTSQTRTDATPTQNDTTTPGPANTPHERVDSKDVFLRTLQVCT
jgi:hypothetical protein